MNMLVWNSLAEMRLRREIVAQRHCVFARREKQERCRQCRSQTPIPLRSRVLLRCRSAWNPERSRHVSWSFSWFMQQPEAFARLRPGPSGMTRFAHLLWSARNDSQLYGAPSNKGPMSSLPDSDVAERFVTPLLANENIAFRLLSIFGFLSTVLCLFVLIRKRRGQRGRRAVLSNSAGHGPLQQFSRSKPVSLTS